MLFSTLPLLVSLALSAPAPTPQDYAPTPTPSSPPDYSYPEPYNCGYALTEHDSSTSVSLPAISWCAPIYYNESIPGYQEAWAFSLYGGCKCGFFREVNDCINAKDNPSASIEGPKGSPGHEVRFWKPKPRWFNCTRTE